MYLDKCCQLGLTGTESIKERPLDLETSCRRKAEKITQPWTCPQFSSLQLLSGVGFFATSWTTACQASLAIINFWSLLKLMSIKLVIPSNHLILYHPFLFLPSIFPSIRVFSKESVLCIRWSKYWSFSFSISPCNEYSGLIYFNLRYADHTTLTAESEELKSVLMKVKGERVKVGLKLNIQKN